MKKFLSIILSLCMIMSLVAVPVFAEESSSMLAPYVPTFGNTTLQPTLIHSLEYADSVHYEANPKLYTAKSAGEAEWLLRVLNSDAQDSITQAIIDTDERVNPMFIVNATNLKEVWLSPKVNAKQFLEDYIDVEINPTLKFRTDYAVEDNGAYTWNFKLYVSDQQLPNGLIGVKNYGNDIMLFFETIVYSGDVYEAYEKKHNGQDVSIPWCTNHNYTEILKTADRVAIEQDCTHARWFYYSCKTCGKPENNPNHIISVGSYDETVYNDATGRVSHDYNYGLEIKKDNFIGMNALGEYVYMKSCIRCGATTYEILTSTDIDESVYNQTMDTTISYKDYTSRLIDGWNQYRKQEALVAMAGENYFPISFAVKQAPVSAKVSSWAESDVNWAKEEGILDESLMGGDFTAPINRAQFASLAVKLAENLLGGELSAAPSGTFDDTDDIYVRKAFAAGITSGTGEGQFSPYATLTRQQMATFIYRALQYVRDNSGIRYTVYTPELEKYTDSWAIQDWARTPLGFMNALGLLKGVSDTALDPDGTCTIEQAIVVAYRSLSAEDIGWYQFLRDGENNVIGGARGDSAFDYNGPDDLFQNQVLYVSGNRIWVTGKVGVIEELSINDYLITSHRYVPGTTSYVSSEHFKPIKDLSSEDLALYNAEGKPNF